MVCIVLQMLRLYLNVGLENGAVPRNNARSFKSTSLRAADFFVYGLIGSVYNGS
jgi:hypothetical protein